MSQSSVDTMRLRAARQRLAQVRQRIRRLAWLAREPESLDEDVPLLSPPAFVRAMTRFQAIRLREEKVALLALRLDRDDLALRRAVAMHLLEHTRNCDTVGCADATTFLILLKGADVDAALVAGQRLHDEIRRLAARMGHLLRIRAICLPVAEATEAADIVHAVDVLLRRQHPAGVAPIGDWRLASTCHRA